MRPTIAELDVQTNEVVVREMTDAEYEAHLTRQTQAAADAQELTQKEADKQSVINKLVALGLTESEVAILVGG